MSNTHKSAKDRTTEVLISLVQSKCKLFHDAQGNTYVKTQGQTKVKGRTQVITQILKIRSAEFNELLRKLNYDATKKGLNKTALEEVVETISTIATYEGSTENVYLRTCQSKGEIIYDLCSPDWSVVKITKDGWKALDSSPVAFTRTPSMKSLPIPTSMPNRNSRRGINKLLKHINIREDELPLLVGWMLMAMQAGSGAYPVLVLNGPAGAGKSTAVRMVRALIDPNQADLLTSPSPDNIKVLSEGNHILAFDNISKVSPQLSDMLCMVATGSSQTVRKKYSDNDAFTVSLKNPIILNGIADFVNRGDLASRSVKISLHKIETRKTEDMAWKEFNDDLPEMFAALLDGLSHALRNIDSVQVDDMTRLADFCQWATAAHTAYGWEESVFMDAYTKNVKSSHTDTLEASPFSSALIDMLDARRCFHGTPMGLLAMLEGNYVPKKSQFSAGWVKTPKGVVNQLENIQTSLAAVGINYEKYKDRTNKTFVKLGDAKFTGCKEYLGHKNIASLVDEDLDF